MYKKLIIICLFPLLFVACGALNPDLKKSSVSHPNQKAFDNEDMYILFALRAEQIRDNKSASELFSRLYEKSGKKEYLYRSLENDLVCQNNKELIAKIEDITQGSLEDHRLVRMKIIALMAEHKILKAQSFALRLLAKNPEVEDYILLANIYIQRKEFQTAVSYLESAYMKNYDEKILDKMAIVMYVNLHQKREAIAQLETHIYQYGCSKLICGRLISFYSNMNNINGLLSTYLRLYSITKNSEFAKKIIQIYGYKKEYLKLIEFLENSYKDDDTLLQLYSLTKKYKKAYLLADKLYKQTNDVDYLGQSAVYEYESQGEHHNKKILKSVVKKLQYVTQEDHSPIYLNYLGYILIDHDIDIKKGIEYVKDALKIDPKSLYYLDSLAWGYYKLGDCKEAKELIEKVINLDTTHNDEVIFHYNSINKCLKN